LQYSNGKYDQKKIVWILVGACFVIAIFYIVSTTVHLAMKAGLNIGIVTTIWAINPFTSALMDYLIYRTALYTHHWLGMFCLIACAIMISFSTAEEKVLDPTEGYKVPAYLPILCSFAMPIVCTF
jgi:multidrug transporter EmrE-like cation transporter